MSNNTKSLVVEERIRLLILKHRGNISLIADEGNVPIEYVERIVRKIKRSKKDEDVNYHIGTTLAQYVMDGAEQRKIYLLEELRREAGKPMERISICCSRPVKEYVWEDEDYYVCMKCGKDCEASLVDTRDKKLIMKLIDQLRTEDESIIGFLAKLGFVTKLMNGDFDQNVNPGAGMAKLISNTTVDMDKSLVDDVNKMDPRTREKLRKELEQKIIDS